jgi:uncharacterized damage-inducible protein DinB
MNADAFRQFYDYHFAENRKMWDRYLVPLSQEQFTRTVDYSHGCVLDQVVHLMSVDEAWFRDLQGAEFPEALSPEELEDRNIIRARWDNIERDMRAYLAEVTDEMLTDKPLEGEDKDLMLWQVLLHVANHGTDHRAQILRQLNDMGVETTYQDYIFYAYEHAED